MLANYGAPTGNSGQIIIIRNHTMRCSLSVVSESVKATYPFDAFMYVFVSVHVCVACVCDASHGQCSKAMTAIMAVSLVAAGAVFWVQSTLAEILSLAEIFCYLSLVLELLHSIACFFRKAALLLK